MSVLNNCATSFRIVGTCDVCGYVARPIHMPLEIHGFYCADHCPVCAAIAQAVTAQKRAAA